MGLLSHRIRKVAKHRQVAYTFLFMRASGDQLRKITALIDSGVIEPVMDQIFPLESTAEAMAYVDKGRAKGKVVVKVK
jgi:NADPH:quinone reductase-like Zn-dependent oxidoreductase